MASSDAVTDAVEKYGDRYDEEVARLLRLERKYDGPVVDDSTLPVTLEKTVERHEERRAQLYKGGIYDRSLTAVGAIDPSPPGEYTALTYGDVRDVVRNLATGFRSLGVRHGDRVGIFAGTRMEWAHSDFALLSAGATVTTVYPGSSTRQVRYLLDDPGASGVVVENEELLERVLAVIDDLELRFIVVMDEVSDRYADRDGVYTLGEVHDQGAKRYDERNYYSWLANLDDLATIIYTSGTTGQPKGVRLTHGNLRSNVNQVYSRFAHAGLDDSLRIDENDVSVSYLPLAHVFERLAGHFVPFAVGVTVGYAESPDTLADDFQGVRPTYATSVPRVYEKIYDRIRAEARNKEVAGIGYGERIFEWALDVGREYYRTESPGIGLRVRKRLADKLVFESVREALGGRIDLLTSGGGSLSPDLCAAYHGMGLPIVEGYGLTETSPVVAINLPSEPEVGTLGVPVLDQEIAIDESVGREVDTDAEGEVGELLVKGPNVTDGYWNDPETTAAAFTDDGYFRTGDVVHHRPDGYLVFEERAKQLLVLSTSKNVAPSPIEDAFAGSDVVDQCLVIGDEEKFVAALVVPAFEGLREAAHRERIDLPDDRAETCDHDFVRTAVEREVARVNERFETYERIKEFRLVPEEWTEENGMLTPSQKKKRRAILDRYADLVDSIYDDTGDGKPESQSAKQS